MSNINLCDCEENWMEIKNKNGSKYLLSSKGRIKNKKNNFIGSNRNGYISIGNSGFFSNILHRIVYRYFTQINIENVNENNHIDHINTITNHNCLCNLKCCSRTENNNNPLTKEKMSEKMKGNKKKLGKYGKNKKARLYIRKNRKKKYLVCYSHQGKRYTLSFYTENEQKECELLINEMYEEKILF